mgnify:CR=1 FL=1
MATDNTCQRNLWEEIEALREKLNHLIEENNCCLDSQEILSVSMELDKLIQIFIEKGQ